MERTSSSGPGKRPLSPAGESRVFLRLRLAIFRNVARQALDQSRLRIALVIGLSILFWLLLFGLFVEGFQFLSSSIDHIGTRDEAVRAIFGLFFASLTVMLIFSAGIILYSGLYRSREAQFLVALPVSSERIFLHKFHEALVFSSWGFVLLGSPMLVAYGLVAVAPWYYYALLMPFLVAFTVIPAGLGAIICLFLIRYIPAVRTRAVGAAVALVIAIAAWIGWTVIHGPVSDLLTPAWFDELLARLQFSEHRLLPSWWLSTGLLEAAEHNWSESVLFLVLLIANALMVHQVGTIAADRIYRRGFQDLHGEVTGRRKLGGAWIDHLAFRAMFFLSPQMRELIVKDLRLFRRDPMQWSQFLIFLGLLGLYFANVRRFHYDVNYATWVNLVSFLNLAVVGLILSTFTSRFIFPMISLEGRQFWILGLLPLRRETILWSKFLFAALGANTACAILVILSDLMLGVLPIVLVVHLVACIVLCTGLSAIAVGLGALMPNLREDSPSKIAAGFGGTLNLVISALYIVVVVMVTAVPCHFYVAAWQSDIRGTWFHTAYSPWLVWGGTALSIALGLAATVIPLRLGMRAFRDLEF